MWTNITTSRRQGQTREGMSVCGMVPGLAMTHSQREEGTYLFSRIHDATGNLTALTFPDGATRTFER